MWRRHPRRRSPSTASDATKYYTVFSKAISIYRHLGGQCATTKRLHKKTNKSKPKINPQKIEENRQNPRLPDYLGRD